METLIKTLNDFLASDTWAWICDHMVWFCLGMLVDIPIVYKLAKRDYADETPKEGDGE